MQPHDTVTVHYNIPDLPAETFHGVISYFTGDGFLIIHTADKEYGVSANLVSYYTASGGDYS